MSRKSERLETLKKRSSSEERTRGQLEADPRSQKKQSGKIRKRSTSVPVRKKKSLNPTRENSSQEEYSLDVISEPQHLASVGSSGGDNKHSSRDTIDTIDSAVSIEWDPSYDKCSTLKDVSDILDLTVCQLASQVSKDRSDSVDINTAPADFALSTEEASGVFPFSSPSEDDPIPYLLTIQNLSTVLETSQEVSSAEVETNEVCSQERESNLQLAEVSEDSDDEELRARLNKLRDLPSSMEEVNYKAKVKELRKQEIQIEVLLDEFNADHVTYEDRESYKDKLLAIGEKYTKWRNDATDLRAELDPDNATEKIWAESVRAKTAEVVDLVANHAKNVKMKVTQVVKEHETTSRPVVAPQVAQTGDSDRKKDLAIKMKMKSARFKRGLKT